MKLLDILKEIGVNNPNKVKIYPYDANEYRTASGDRMYDGDDRRSLYTYHGRYYAHHSPSEKGIKHFFTLEASDTNLILKAYTIPKSQVEIVDKLQEIGINNPNMTPETMDNFMYDLYYKIGDEKYKEAINILKNYGAGRQTLMSFFQSLNPSALNKLHHVLQKLENNTLQEIGINKPKIVDVNIIKPLIISISKSISNDSRYIRVSDREHSISGIFHKYNWPGISYTIWLKNLDQKTLYKIYMDLLKLKEKLENEQ